MCYFVWLIDGGDDLSQDSTISTDDNKAEFVGLPHVSSRTVKELNEDKFEFEDELKMSWRETLLLMILIMKYVEILSQLSVSTIKLPM